MKVKEYKNEEEASDEINKILSDVAKHLMSVMRANKIDSCNFVIDITNKGCESGACRITFKSRLNY